MSKQPCAFCGLPVRALSHTDERDVYCCSGCAVAAQIPTGDGDLPISRQLIVSLALAFAYFNQFLFWSLAFALRGEGRVLLAGRFDVITLALGCVVLIATVAVFLRTGVYRLSDWVVLTLVASLAAIGAVSGIRGELPSVVPWVLATNTLMVILLSRGWVKRLLRKRGSKLS